MFVRSWVNKQHKHNFLMCIQIYCWRHFFNTRSDLAGKKWGKIEFSIASVKCFSLIERILNSRAMVETIQSKPLSQIDLGVITFRSYHHHHRDASTDIPDPSSPLLPIVHRLWQVFRATSRILTELLYVCSNWPTCFCSAICGGP